MAIYAEIKGTRQGAIAGAVSAQSFSGQIQVETVVFGVGSPADVSTGLATGKRVARPVVITKPVDKSSPLLHRACTTNESLTVKLSYVVEGAGHKAYMTLNLTNGMIRDFNQETSFNGGSLEKISFTYTKIEFTWTEGGIVSTDDWMNAN